MSLQTYHVFDYNIQMKLLKILRISLSFSFPRSLSLSRFIFIGAVPPSYSLTLPQSHRVHFIAIPIYLAVYLVCFLSFIHPFLAISVDEFVRFRHAATIIMNLCVSATFFLSAHPLLWLMSCFVHARTHSHEHFVPQSYRNSYTFALHIQHADIVVHILVLIPHPCAQDSSLFGFVFCRIDSNKEELIL